MMKRALPLCAIVLLGALAGAQKREEKLRAEYEERALRVLLEAGERHLDYGLKLRDQGLVAQAAQQIRRAVEVSEGRHSQASYVLSVMRRYDDGFWKKRVTPSAKRLDGYEKRAQKLEREDREARFELAEWAWRKDLRDEAREAFLELVGDGDGPVELDSKERVVLDVGELPEELSAELVAGAVTINGRLYLRDAFLERCAALEAIHEHASSRLVVRCQTSAEDARALHELGVALLPHLEEELGGRPARRPHAFVFAGRADYEAYLDAAGLGGYHAVSGVADLGTFTAIVCAEGKSLQDVQGTFLHELTHVFDHGVSPVRLPEWYREGLADTFGGQGTFRWDGEELAVGLPMERFRIETVLDGGLRWPIGSMHAVDPLTLWASDSGLASRFYAQSWALYRFLSREAAPDVRERFDEWTAMCRGTLAGDGDGATSVEGAQRLFERLFAADLPEIEQAFVAWLEEL